MNYALIARERQEDPAGTAVHIKRRICLEIPQGWQPKFKIHDLNIPQDVQDAIQKDLEEPRTCLQLIRGNKKDRADSTSFVCDETGLHTCQVKNLQNWAHYDWTDFLLQQSSVDPSIQKWHVCTTVQFAEIHLRKQSITSLICQKDQMEEDISLVHWIGQDDHGEKHMYSFEIERKGIGVFAKASCKDDLEKEIKAFSILSERQHATASITYSSLTK